VLDTAVKTLVSPPTLPANNPPPRTLTHVHRICPLLLVLRSVHADVLPDVWFYFATGCPRTGHCHTALGLHILCRSTPSSLTRRHAPVTFLPFQRCPRTHYYSLDTYATPPLSAWCAVRHADGTTYPTAWDKTCLHDGATDAFSAHTQYSTYTCILLHRCARARSPFVVARVTHHDVTIRHFGRLNDERYVTLRLALVAVGAMYSTVFLEHMRIGMTATSLLHSHLPAYYCPTATPQHITWFWIYDTMDATFLLPSSGLALRGLRRLHTVDR